MRKRGRMGKTPSNLFGLGVMAFYLGAWDEVCDVTVSREEEVGGLKTIPSSHPSVIGRRFHKKIDKLTIFKLLFSLKLPGLLKTGFCFLLLTKSSFTHI